MRKADAQTRMVKLGQQIRRCREEQKLSQERLAQMVGTDQAYISGIERAQANPSIATCIALADALDVSLSELIDF